MEFDFQSLYQWQINRYISFYNMDSQLPDMVNLLHCLNPPDSDNDRVCYGSLSNAVLW